MRKLKISVLAFATFMFTTFSACKKNEKDIVRTNTTTQTNTPNVNPNQSTSYNGKNHPLVGIFEILVAAVVVTTVVIAMSEGQATNVKTTTTVSPDGSKTTTTTYNCDGVGHCHISASKNGINLNNGFIEADSYDYTNMPFILVKNNDGKILLGMDADVATADQINTFFYDDYIQFLSPNQHYEIDNQDILQELGLSQPFIIDAGSYPVYNGSDGNHYIIVKN